MATISFDVKDLVKGFAEYDEKVRRGRHMYAKQAAAKLEREAKAKAPWTDQTGAARRGLHAYTEELISGGKDVERINLAHSVDYGVFLELAHNKNYAILEPTIRLNADEILEGLAEYMKKV